MDKLKWMDEWLPIIIGIVLLMVFFASVCHAETIPDEIAIKCLIGEGENQGQEGLNALAHALKNRGTIKGVYGYKAKRVIKHLYSDKTLSMATKSWQEAKTGQDSTLGATGWGNKNDLIIFRQSKWWKKCHITVKVKDHYFYRCEK